MYEIDNKLDIGLMLIYKGLHEYCRKYEGPLINLFNNNKKKEAN